MSRRFSFLLSILILLSISLYAQTTPVTLIVTPYGISPREAGLDTSDIYKYPFTGLHNVGVGTMTYLKVQRSSGKLTSPVWTVVNYPLNSKFILGKVVDKQNDSTQVIAFTPDKPGTYNIQVVDGQFVGTITINSAKYLGYTNTVVNGVDQKVNCATCHEKAADPIVTNWSNTKHATYFTRAMNGQISSHYAVTCIGCHTTGFDKNPTAVNDGFDDLTFTFPKTLGAGGNDSLVTKFPDAMKRANIQCESCHGPAGNHVGDPRDFRIEKTFDFKVCAYCHDDGSKNIIPQQFASANHATLPNTASENGAGREACVRCHTGSGYAQFASGILTTDPNFDNTASIISCQACHDPHAATNQFQLRLTTATLVAPGGKTTAVTNAGMGITCFNCHQSRVEANAGVAATPSSRFGPHHGPQGDIIESNNMLSLGGIALKTSNHIGATVDACVKCHMFATPNNAQGVQLIGGHSFRMSSPTGVDNMLACAQCHGATFGTSFDQVRFFYNGVGDLDGDGVINGLQIEVKGMIAKIYAKLPQTSVTASTGQPTPDKTWTKDQLSALWNAVTAYEDKSNGIHNPKYVVSALLGSYKLLGLTSPALTSIDAVSNDNNLPSDFVIYQNYPNPFNPSTNIKFSIPQATHVKLTIYDAVGKVVQILIDDEMAPGIHTVQWAPRNVASGIYIYRIEAGNYVKANKMLLMK
jgi:hypothetical protein